MKDQKIVVAYDGSPDSEKALCLAVTLSKALLTKIVLVSVVDLLYAVKGEVGVYEPASTAFRKAVGYAIDLGKMHAKELGITAEGVILEGNPAEEIINYANEVKACMIVVGTRGKGGFHRLVLGSTAQALVAYADIPVLVAR